MQLTWNETGSNKCDRVPRLNPSGVAAAALSTKGADSESVE